MSRKRVEECDETLFGLGRERVLALGCGVVTVVRLRAGRLGLQGGGPGEVVVVRGDRMAERGDERALDLGDLGLLTLNTVSPSENRPAAR